jgi:hypothetical protein
VRWLSPLAALSLSACAATSVAPSPSATGPLSVDSPGPTNAGGVPSASASGAPTGSACRSPAEHVYHPYRLQVRNPCLTLTGVIDRVKDEPDGDYHVRLHLDPRFANLVNSANVAQQGGDLVLEPVCIHAITQADAVGACAGYTNPLLIPARGTHVIATGAYVLDTDHGWMELHPLWGIQPG